MTYDISTYYTIHWYHDIGTIIQFYRIVGLGIKLKSMSVRSWR